MRLRNKYGLGEYGYILVENEIKQVCIKKIIVEIMYQRPMHYSYSVQREDQKHYNNVPTIQVTEKELFRTKKKLFKAMVKESNKR